MKRHMQISAEARISMIAVLATMCPGLRLSAAADQQTSTKGIAGDWQGTLKVGAAELRLVLHISEGDGGS